MFKKIFNFKDYNFKNYAFSIIVIILCLGGIGTFLIYMLEDSDANMAVKQLLGYAGGIVLAICVSMIDYKFICKFFVPLYIIGVGLLLICKYSNSYPIYGWSHYTARRWIKIGGDPSAGINNHGFEFMPSELTKILLILVLAKVFDLTKKYISKLWVLVLVSLLAAVPTYLVLIQTDFSTSVVMALMFATMVFASGIPYRIIGPIVAVLIPGVIAFLWYIQQDFQIILNEYQQNRIFAMLYPEDYPDLIYQQSNAASAISSGGIIGKYLTHDTGIRGSAYVPVIESDFIFTAIAEEFGFVGCLIVIALFLLLIIKILKIAHNCRDYLGRMISVGIAALIMFQTFFNIGVVTSLLPNTGITLPFVSSGLSSLLTNMIMLGIILNISMQQNERVHVPLEEDIL